MWSLVPRLALAVVLSASAVPAQPVARSGAALAYDAERGEVVLFGGSDTASERLGDTWTWSRADGWARHDVAGPSPRSDAQVAYDAARQRVVLFGGLTPDGRSGETWLWDGGAWTLADTTGPPPRQLGAMAYDHAREQVVLFGGSGEGRLTLGDTWLWDGACWTETETPVAPSPRGAHAMAFDGRTDEVALVGGYADGALADHWGWDGTTWTLRDSVTTPPRLHHSLVSDPATNTLLLYGGFGESEREADVWAHGLGRWGPISVGDGPGARAEHDAVAVHGLGMVVFGGVVGQEMEVDARRKAADLWALPDTWTRLPDGPDIREAIDAAVEPYVAAGNFRGVVAVGRDEERPTIRTYGFASAELRADHEPHGVFMIGSVSKQMTAAAILLLAEDGLLALDDPVGTHLPGFPHGAVTVHQLLTHTSGVEDVYSLPRFGATEGRSGSFTDVIADLGAAPLLFEPGTDYLYSNGGYAVLAAVIEAVARQPFGEVLAARLFEPLGMTDSAHDAPGPAARGRVPGYVPWGRRDVASVSPVTPAYLTGSGSVWSSARDLLTWTEALHTGRLLSPASTSALTTDYGNGYGYGVSVFERFGRRVVGHDGRVAGYASDLALYVDDGVTVAVLSNVESVARDAIRRAVAAVVFGEPVSAPTAPVLVEAAPADLGDLVGVYAFGPSFRVSIREADGRLLARANEGGSSELVPTTDGTWFSRMLSATVRFGRDEAGRVDRLLWGAGDGAPVGQRLD